MRVVQKLLALSLVLAPLAAKAETIDLFVGRFSGGSIQLSGKDEAKRDLTVEISKSPDDKGFLVTWKTVIHKASGKDEEQLPQKVRFIPTQRNSIYSAASRQNMFGKQVPIDPIYGSDPYYWARISGKTLSVFNLIINDDGGYEMQTYHRTLTKDGDMKIEFQRIRDGVPQRTVTGLLKRVK